MKRFFRFVMAAAVIFSAVSCAKEDISSSIGGGEVEVTFTANLADLGTRAYGEANNVNVVYLGIYDQKGNYLEDLTVDEGYPVDPSNHTASIPVVLLKDKTYDLVFWAQDKNVNCYEMKWTERKMSVSYTGAISQDDTRDAFFLVDNDFVAGEEKNPEFRLYRPFAQLNAGLSADEVTKIGNNGVDVSEIKSEVVVKQVASTLNLSEEATDTAIDVADFVDASFIIAAKPEEALKVSDVDYEYLSMNYLLVDTKRNVDVEYIFTDADNTTYARNYYNVPLQRNYRTNIVGNLLSSEYDFNVIIVPGFDGDENLDAKTQIFNVNTNADLKAALTEKVEDHIEHIIINLEADLTYDVAAWANDAMGGEFTKDITINGIPASRAAEPYTLTFNQTNSDWNNIVTKGAKLILNDLKITNRGYNDGPWNRHDINFACEVEMNNVISDKALALKAGATLKNTTITENNTSDVYAIWIQPNGQTVTLENCNIDTRAATDGRGIKIDEQYVDSPKKVILNVSGTSFATEEKSAILVKSVAGAEIVWGDGNDISAVAADSVYAVWVDEASEAYIDLVNVTGAKVRFEGSTVITEQENLNEAAKNGGHIDLPAGQYTFPTNIAEGTIINCAEDVVFTGKSSLNINGATVNGGTFSNESGSVVGGTVNGNFKNCTFTGSNAFRNAYAGENCYFEDCVFDGAVYGFHFDGGANPATFVRCTFSGFNAFGSAVTLLTLKDCTFKSTGKSGYNGGNFWGKTVMENTTFIFDGNASTEWIGINKADGIALNNCKAVDANNAELSLLDYMANIDNGDKVTIDGVVYTLYKDGSYEIDGKLLVSTNEQLKAAVEAGRTEILLGNGNGYDLNGIQKDGLTLIGYGDNVQIANTTKYASGKATGAIWKAINLKNMTITNTVYTMADGSNATFEDVTFAAGFRQGYGKGVVFTNCTFGSNSEGYALHFQTDSASEGGEIKLTGCQFNGGKVHLGGKRAYTFSGCEFATGTDFQVWSNISLENCTVNGVAVTASNMATLFPNLNAEKVTIK